MDILICIDDTDTLSSTGTGHLAAELQRILESRGWGTCAPITRHQLFVHPDIAYTSHNSAMCWHMRLHGHCLEAVIACSQQFLRTESAEGSDPGLCIAALPALIDRDALLAFGRQAQQAVLDKELAYRLADKLHIHLSEHGGTGIGVIGALAGAGLRLSGNDGRFRGHINPAAEGATVPVAHICAHSYVSIVRPVDAPPLSPETPIRLGAKIKAVLRDGQATLLVYRQDDCWHTCPKERLRSY